MLGFLTREFTVDRGRGPEALLAVYVPTNHLYLGDVMIFERDRAVFPDISVEDGIRIFLTGGMALPARAEAIIRAFVRGEMTVSVLKFLRRAIVAMILLAADCGAGVSADRGAASRAGAEVQAVAPRRKRRGAAKRASCCRIFQSWTSAASTVARS